MKIKKGKSYTYEELERIWEEAMSETLMNPCGELEKKHDDDINFKIMLSLSGVVILHSMKANLFEKEGK